MLNILCVRAPSVKHMQSNAEHMLKLFSCICVTAQRTADLPMLLSLKDPELHWVSYAHSDHLGNIHAIGSALCWWM